MMPMASMERDPTGADGRPARWRRSKKSRGMRAHPLVRPAGRHLPHVGAEPSTWRAESARELARRDILKGAALAAGSVFCAPLACFAQSQTVNLVGAAATAG